MNKIARLGSALVSFAGRRIGVATDLRYGARSAPHASAKERERAKRFYMVDTHPNGEKRSAPTMEQHSSTWFF
ncbi:hypothetical protein SAMN05446935_6132 [Burkholderia sp. YR290]|nr:hypothetical protein SAMN05446935_6132 [Burkholderia sp. YR290]